MPHIEEIQFNNFHIEKAVFHGSMATTHVHNCYEIYYIAEGERDYFIGEEFYKVGHGDLVIIPPNVIHRTVGKGASRYLVYFTDDAMKKYITKDQYEIITKGLEHYLYHPPENVTKTIEILLANCLHAFGDGQNIDETMIANYIFCILFLSASLDNMYIGTASYETRLVDGRMSKVIKYINDNYASIDSIQEIADKFYISRFYLCRLFNNELGVSLVTYLNTIKVRAACELLVDKSIPLTEIAVKCGFNSASYFCKIFKREKGITPTEYRMRYGT